jgi:glycosyltransferase involved in cell wall biosynthesis
VRVLAVGNMYPPHHLGGYEVTWCDADRFLAAQGHEVRALTTDFRLDRAGAEEGAADVHRELRWYWRDHEFPRLGLRERIAIERHNAAVLDRHLAELRPDAVAWWAMGGMSLSLIERVRRRGIPAAGFVCDAWMGYGPKVDAWLRAVDRPLIRTAAERLTGIPATVELGSAARWVFLSESLRRESAGVWRLSDTTVVHKGVSKTDFAPRQPRDWRHRLLYVGRIDRRKGIDLAISALGALPDEARLVIDGDGDGAYLRELGELAAREGVAARVEFVNSAGRAELRERYAEADAVLFPVRWEEPWGLVPLEAMAVGTPVIASGRGGSGEYLRDRENCLIVDPDRGPEALAAGIRELAGDEELRGALSEGGTHTTAAIDEDEFSRAAERALEGVVAEARAA